MYAWNIEFWYFRSQMYYSRVEKSDRLFLICTHATSKPIRMNHWHDYTVVADCSSYDSATTENDGEVEMQGKRRSGCCLHSNLSDWIADAKVLLLNWSATTLWLLSSFAGTFLRCRWWITSVDDHVEHNNVVPERQSHRMRPSQAVASGQAVTLTATNRAPCPVSLWMMHSDCERRSVSASDWLLGVCACPRVLWYFILIICWHLHRACYDMDETSFQHQ